MSKIKLPDCGSNSCFYGHGGMRTNGPCDCHHCPACGAQISRQSHRQWCTTPAWTTALMQVCAVIPCSIQGAKLHELALRHRAVRELLLLWVEASEESEEEASETLKALETCISEISRAYPTPCESS